MWTRLRVAWIGCVWEARCSQLALGQRAVPAGVRVHATARALLARLVSAARLQFLRVETDVRRLDPSYPSSWFRGRDPRLSLGLFLRDWGMDGRFCSARLEPEPALELEVDAVHPVPLPGDAELDGLLVAANGGPGAGAA
jgi:hypothetical protein